MASGNAIRGTRVGSSPVRWIDATAERTEAVPRRAVGFWCANGHHTEHAFAADVPVPAQWDCLELIMQSLARDYPEHFQLARDGARWHWVNRPLEIETRFTFGNPATLPYEPLEYITRQVQGDWLFVPDSTSSTVGLPASARDAHLRAE